MLASSTPLVRTRRDAPYLPAERLTAGDLREKLRPAAAAAKVLSELATTGRAQTGFFDYAVEKRRT
jgi:hypothetical protein